MSCPNWTKTKPEDKQDRTSGDTDNPSPAVDELLVEAVVERLRLELPALIEAVSNPSSLTVVPGTYDAVYTSQIAKAQEFLNENHSADLSRVKCLLHKLLPKEYFDLVEQLREHQDVRTIYNICGGRNVIAPKASHALQEFKEKK